VLLVEQVAIQGHHVLIGFAFQKLQLIIQLFDLFEVYAISQGADQLADYVGGALQQTDLRGEIDSRYILRSQQDSFDKLLNRLWDLVERVGELLDVLALEGGNKCRVDRRADLLGNLLVLAAGPGKLMER